MASKVNPHPCPFQRILHLQTEKSHQHNDTSPHRLHLYALLPNHSSCNHSPSLSPGHHGRMWPLFPKTSLNVSTSLNNLWAASGLRRKLQRLL